MDADAPLPAEVAADLPPVWLLDVDGVLNALDPGGLGWPDYVTFSARGFLLRYSPTLTSRIAELHATGRVEVRWLTTWEGDADRLLAPRMGLPPLAVASAAGEASAGGGWWKLPVAQRVREESGRRLVWTDDDLDRVDEALEWARDQAGDVLAVSPSSYVGLTPDDLAVIEAWL